MSRQAEQFRIDVEEVGHDTGKAVLVTWQGQEKWIPLSQVHSIHRDPVAPYLYITVWWARKDGYT